MFILHTNNLFKLFMYDILMKSKITNKTKLDKLFDDFTKNSIFKDKSSLQTNYTPETIPHRDKQITQIASILAPSLRLEKPSNLFVYGKTGTGKTLSVQYVCNQLSTRAKRNNISLNIKYINCKLKKVADTEYRILSELITQLGHNVPSTGLPTDTVYQRFIDIVDSKKQLFIIILDEIDQAVKKIGDEFLYNFTRLNSSLTQSQISVIGISNDLMFLDLLDPRVKSSLSEEEIIFPPYNALQLQDILKHRSKIAFKTNIVGDNVILKCAALAAREHGDARRALDMLRIAGELTERDRKTQLTIEYLDKAQQKIERDKVLDVIETQPKHQQLVLLSIIQLNEDFSRKRKEPLNNVRLFTGDIYNVYKQLCNQSRLDPLTQRRISDILSEFDMLGIINAQVISKGRYGRTREIRLSTPLNLIPKIKQLIKSNL